MTCPVRAAFSSGRDDGFLRRYALAVLLRRFALPQLKGLTVGQAQVSPKHAGFIVNLGNASCGDVLQLIDRIRETVYREKGIQLECEVRMTE